MIGTDYVIYYMFGQFFFNAFEHLKKKYVFLLTEKDENASSNARRHHDSPSALFPIPMQCIIVIGNNIVFRRKVFSKTGFVGFYLFLNRTTI